MARIGGVVDALQLPSPFTLQGVVDAVANLTGRRLILHPLDDLPPEISGVSLPAGDDADGTYVVCYDNRVPPWSQMVIVLHELGHHLLEHPPRHDIPLGGGSLAGLWPRPGHTDPTVVLARTSFTDPREVEAELFATLMMERVERLQRAESRPQLRGIRRGVEPPRRWSR